MAYDNIFEIKNLKKSYGSKKVLRGISFDIRRGEILGFIGASGAGKTTLLNLLVGFILPDSGKITFTIYHNKKSINYLVWDKPLLVNKLYGFASQTPSFYENLTVRENLSYFGAMYGLSPEAVRKNSDVLLRLLGINTSQHVLGKDLSGGMKRRLDIACALIHNPSLLILDEPTADLDPVLRTKIWEIVKKINMRGTTIILSSHHLHELDALCNRIAIMKDGKLVDIDTPDKLKIKYNKMQEILIESYPGNYKLLEEQLKNKNILEMHKQGTSMIIKSEEPEKVILDVLQTMKNMKESLIDLRLNKPNLDDVFVSVYSNKITDENNFKNNDGNKK